VSAPIPEETWSRALSRARRLATYHPGVVGVDRGLLFREEQGRRVRGEGIRFHVRRKLPAPLVPLSEELPKEILGIPCDVLQASYQPHAGSPRDPFDPIRPGISIGNRAFGTSGTLGCFVRDRHSGSPCLLSNWHVAYGARRATTGDPVVQPALPHRRTGTPRTVATLLDTLFFSHNLDAAIARLAEGVDIAPESFGNGMVIAAVGEPQVGMRLVRAGDAAEPPNRAMVDGINGRYKLNYRPYGLRDPVWLSGFHLVPDPEAPVPEISTKGDSGSIWVDPEGQGIGLNFGGEDGLGPTAEYALAHPLNVVFTLLDIELL